MKKSPADLLDSELIHLLMPGESAEVVLFLDATLLRELLRRFEAAREKAWMYDDLCK